MPAKRAETAQELRRRAEEQFSVGKTATTATPAPADAQNLIDDLLIHQIELEMQVEELRIRQSELDIARSRYYELYDLAPMGYLTINTQGSICEANLSAATMLAVSRTVLFNNRVTQFICPEDQDAYYLRRKRLLEGGGRQDWEMRLKRADGSAFWAHLLATPQYNGEYWIVFNDISERKQLEEDKHLLEQQFQQTQKLESLGVLAGGIAHDFNNILSVIMGYCGLTKRDYESAAENLPKIERAVERAAALCSQMLAYAGKASLTKSQVNTWMLVEEMVSMLKTTLQRNVVIKHELDFDIPFIIGDASQLRQVVMNLIINAAEAIGDSEGEVGVWLAKAEIIREEQQEKDHLGFTIPAGQYIRFEVSDNGCGMDDDTRRKIFEPFYTTKFTGRGLGMSAVLGIIKAHKGLLQLESRLGHGTTFRVYLPVQLSKTESEETQQITASVPWQGSGTILLAEDEVEIKYIAIALLKKLGFNVIEAANGKEALELYQQNAADITLVVTDIGMPVMNGYELFYKLRQLDPQLPILISSGLGEDDIASKIPRELIAGMINKPYRFEQLREVLMGVVEKPPGHGVPCPGGGDVNLYCVP